jgi:hypothetical protein
VIITDTNEFHPLVNAVMYRDAREPDGTNHPIVIMRATYGTDKVDAWYPTSLRLARDAHLIIGHYGYMVANEDPSAQGRYFADAVKNHGGVRFGDTFWCDDEEGQGNQSTRAMQFLAAAHGVLHDSGADAGVYSGASFWVAHLTGLPSGVKRWVAAYSPNNPRLPGQNLWQFTDAHRVPGVSGAADASIFRGTLDDWKRLFGFTSPSTTRLLEANMEYLNPGEKKFISWDKNAATIRVGSDSQDGSTIPGHIVWFTADDANTAITVTSNNVSETAIPGGRGAIVHRDDAPDSPTAGHSFGVTISS